MQSHAVEAHSRVLTRDAAYRWLLALADIAAAAVALVLDVVVLGDDQLNWVALAVVPLVVPASQAVGLYDSDQLLIRRGTLDEAPSLFRVSTLYTFIVWLSQGFFIDGYFGRDQLLALWALLFAGMLVSRASARALARAVTTEQRCLVVGGAETAAAVERKLSLCHGVKGRVVGRVPLSSDDLDAGDGPPILGRAEALDRVIAAERIDRAIIAPSETRPEALLELIGRAREAGAGTSVIPRLLEVVGSSVELDELDGATLMAVRRHGLSRSSRAIKRTVDIAGAGIGLLVLAPLFATIALAIKLNSRGPVFFRQRRMGRNDSVFEMLKFRTMVAGAEAQQAALASRNEASGLFKISDDPRVTAVGRVLRRASLDELPQLWNVIRGEMSLIGPRPFVLEEDKLITGWGRRRLLVRPGMTGLWQIFGSSRIPLEEAIKIDYLYGATWSLWLDAKILLRTVPYVLARRGL